MTKIINLTPHPINIIDSNNRMVSVINPSGLARVSETTIDNGSIGNIPLVKKKYGNVEGLPPEEKDTRYIVSVLVAQALSHRKDLLVPAELVRNSDGIIMGCKALCEVNKE